MRLSLLSEEPPRVSLHESLREECHAAGPVPRGWLQARIARRTGRRHDEIVAAVEELARVGDLLLGGGGLIGPAPLRAVPLPGGGALLVGARPRRWLGMEPTDDLPRRVGEAPEDATVVPLERWTGLDRTPNADSDFLETIRARECREDDNDWSQAWCWRDGKFRPAEGHLGLWRLRMPGRWFRYAWADESGRRPMSTDEGVRALFALSRGEREPIDTTAGPAGVRIDLPFIPRAEARFVMACASRRDGRSWAIPRERWTEVAATLETRLGLTFGEPRGEA